MPGQLRVNNVILNHIVLYCQLTFSLNKYIFWKGMSPVFRSKVILRRILFQCHAAIFWYLISFFFTHNFKRSLVLLSLSKIYCWFIVLIIGFIYSYADTPLCSTFPFCTGSSLSHALIPVLLDILWCTTITDAYNK